MKLTDGHRTVTGVLVRDSSVFTWLRVHGQLHAFQKAKWRATAATSAHVDLEGDGL